MKLINFQCNNEECSYEEEDLFRADEKIPNQLEHFCPMCGGILKIFNLKNNQQNWKFNDKR